MTIHRIDFTALPAIGATGIRDGGDVGQGLCPVGGATSGLINAAPCWDFYNGTDLLFSLIGWGDRTGKASASFRISFDARRGSQVSWASPAWPANLTSVAFKRESDDRVECTLTNTSAVSALATGNEAYNPDDEGEFLVLATEALVNHLVAWTRYYLEIDGTFTHVVTRWHEDAPFRPNQAYTTKHIIYAERDITGWGFYQLKADASIVDPGDTFEDFLAANSVDTEFVPAPPRALYFVDSNAAPGGVGDSYIDPYQKLPAVDDGSLVKVLSGSTVGSDTLTEDTLFTAQSGILGNGTLITQADHTISLGANTFGRDGTFAGLWVNPSNPDANNIVFSSVTISGGVVTAYSGVAEGTYLSVAGVLTLHDIAGQEVAAIDTATLS